MITIIKFFLQTITAFLSRLVLTTQCRLSWNLLCSRPGRLQTQEIHLPLLGLKACAISPGSQVYFSFMGNWLPHPIKIQKNLNIKKKKISIPVLVSTSFLVNHNYCLGQFFQQPIFKMPDLQLNTETNPRVLSSLLALRDLSLYPFFILNKPLPSLVRLFWSQEGYFTLVSLFTDSAGASKEKKNKGPQHLACRLFSTKQIWIISFT